MNTCFKRFAHKLGMHSWSLVYVNDLWLLACFWFPEVMFAHLHITFWTRMRSVFSHGVYITF